MRFVVYGFVLASLLAFDAPAAAYGQERGINDIPPGYRPPRGMCRIWLNGVPAGQQPAPTDCSTAVRNRPPNARVIFGDEGPGKAIVPRSLQPADNAAPDPGARQEREALEQQQRERQRVERDERERRAQETKRHKPDSEPRQKKRKPPPPPRRRPG